MSRNNLNRKLKYSIRKKKNGGGAASFIVGSVVLGGLMLGGATTVNADEVTQTGTGTDTSAKSSGSTDISGTEVALSSPSNGKPAAPRVNQQHQLQQLLNLQLMLLHQQKIKHNQQQVQHLRVHQKQQLHQ